MQKLIDTVSSFYATGIPPQAKLFKVPFGQYQDRLVIIYPKTPNQLVYLWADPPYLIWSEPTEIVSDSADYPPTGFMDADGNIYVVYTKQSSLDLLELKMSFTQGSWSLGTVNTVCNVGQNYFPSILKDSIDRLWIAWTYYDPATERYYVHAKTSQDDGSNWGIDPSDPGPALTGGSESCFSQLLFHPPYVRCFYSDDSTLLAYRSHELEAATWDPQQTIYSGSQIDDDFRADLSSDNKVGIVFPGMSALLYKEFDGNNWSGLFSVDNCLPESLGMKFLDNVPYVFFAKNIGNHQNQLFFSYKDDSSFTSPVPYEPGQKTFDQVFCYDASASNKYSDRTAEASDSNPADVFHPTSGGLIKDAGDALYLGMDAKFNLARIALSTAGIGGQAKWQYWDGESWTDFAPVSGNYNLDSEEKAIILWQDLNSVPAGWQRCPVNAVSQFWIRIAATTPYATAPVGTQVTSVPEARHLQVTR
ncbi:MAG: hypothetical protein WBF13_09475 [Candidatus Zixiibacteriota bacterium]